MNISEIRTMKNNEALFVYANKKPLRMNIKPYYKNRKYKNYSKLKPYTINNIKFNDNIEYVNLH